MGLMPIQEALAISTHHDASTGTSKSKVAASYTKALESAYSKYTEFLAPIFSSEATDNIKEQVEIGKFCELGHSSADCEIYKKLLDDYKPVLISVYNPVVSHKRVLRIRLPRSKYSLINGDNVHLPADTFCYKVQFSEIYFNCEIFVSVELKAYSMNYFKIIPNDEVVSGKSLLISKENITEFGSIDFFNYNSLIIKDAFNNFEYKSCVSEGSVCRKRDFSLGIKEYKGATGYPNSGAYVFYPSTAMKYEYFDPLGAEIHRGKHVTLVRIYSNTALVTMRFYKNDEHFTKDSIELETFVRSIDHTFSPSELVLVIKDINLKNNKKFFTDSSALEVEEREYKAGKDGDEMEDVTANYYPVNAFLYLKDPFSNKRIIVNNDRSQGGSSQSEGEIELMFHRKSLRDDAKGMDEGVSEEGTQFFMKHYISFDDSDTSIERNIQYYTEQPPVQYFAECKTHKFSKNADDIVKYTMKLPEIENLKVYLHPFNENMFLLRYLNLNPSRTVNAYIPSSAIEMSLTGNQEKSEMVNSRIKWDENDKHDIFTGDSNSIDVKPLQIRTFTIDKEILRKNKY